MIPVAIAPRTTPVACGKVLLGGGGGGRCPTEIICSVQL